VNAMSAASPEPLTAADIATPTAADTDPLRQQLIAALRTIQDPELPTNIVDLGLIYSLDIDAARDSVAIHMTLTAPGCPLAQTFPATVAATLEALPGIRHAQVDLVWEPTWDRERMSPAARYATGLW